MTLEALASKLQRQFPEFWEDHEAMLDGYVYDSPRDKLKDMVDGVCAIIMREVADPED